MRPLLAAALLAFLAGAGRAQGESARVDALFSAYASSGVPGCAAGVLRDGAVVHRKAYGAASLELGVPLTPGSAFYMASLSKQFTAAAVLLAAERGLLSLDDGIRGLVPELPEYASGITLRRLLRHESGLRDQLELAYLAGRDWADLSTRDFLALLARQERPHFAPGERWEYSNANYFLLALAVSRAAGKPFSAFAEEALFRPLGMARTRFHEDRSAVVPGRVPAYRPAPGGGFQASWSLDFDQVGDGGLYSTLDDMLRWDRSFEGGLGAGPAFDRERLATGTLLDGRRTTYAAGLFVEEDRGLGMIRHSGSLYGYKTAFLRVPSRRLTVVCLCNRRDADAMEAAWRIADIYLGRAPEAPALPQAPLPAPGLYYQESVRQAFRVEAGTSGVRLDGALLLPRGPGAFRNRRKGWTLEARAPGPGEPALTLAADNAAPETLLKLSPPAPSPGQLRAYAGRYRCPELDADLTVGEEGGRLLLRRGAGEPSPLEPLRPDEFRGEGFTVSFRRGEGGEAAGGILNGERARGLVFARAERP